MEMLVGMVLGLIVVTGAIAIYLTTSRSYSEVEQVAQLNENVRFAELVVTDALRHAGFSGEVIPNNVDTTGMADPVGDCAIGTEVRASAYELNISIFAVVEDSGGTLPNIGCISDAYEDTDVLIIKSAATQPISDGPRSKLYDGTATGLEKDGDLSYPHDVKPNKVYILSNFDKGIMYDSDDTQPSIESGSVVPGGAAWEYRYQLYYVRQPAGESPRLARKVLQENGAGAMALITEDLVPDVEDFSLRFGIDTNGDTDVDKYSTVAETEAADDWGNIVAIEVALLVSSQAEDANYEDNKTYNILGDTVLVPTGREHMRRAVTQSNVSLRNIKFSIRG